MTRIAAVTDSAADIPASPRKTTALAVAPVHLVLEGTMRPLGAAPDLLAGVETGEEA